MNRKTLSNAEDEAREFLFRCEQLRAEMLDNYLPTSKESSAVRRKSMGLTRALADLRRPS